MKKYLVPIRILAKRLRSTLRHDLLPVVRQSIRSTGFDIKRYRPDHDLPLQLTEMLAALSAFRRLGNRHSDDDRYLFVKFCIAHFHKSNSQIYQDLFVQYQSKEKKGGFFVEFGAGNGINLSNTYMLEKHYQWDGILSEPGRVWHSDLTKNRSCTVDFRCVWDKSGEHLQFIETAQPEFSTVDSLSGGDMHLLHRQGGAHYSVDTVSLNELLDEFHAPRRIDYLSIDTEGSELRILNSLDFDRYDIRIITVEHNNTRQREQIFSLLSSKGFVRKFEEFSWVDDWYVKCPFGD